jgi:hypothetical protein
VGQASRLSSETTGNLVGAHGHAPFLDSRLHGNDRRLLPTLPVFTGTSFRGVAMTVRQIPAVGLFCPDEILPNIHADTEGIH